MFIIILTYAQISIVQLILKLLRHVSELINSAGSLQIVLFQVDRRTTHTHTHTHT
jgi:hypothetical protein